MGLGKNKGSLDPGADWLPGDAVSGQPLFSLFNKLAMAGRKDEAGFAVQILGPNSGCGVSTIAGGLAEFAALNIDGPVALIDADPLKQSQFQRVGAKYVASLQDVQQGRATLAAAGHRMLRSNLTLFALTPPVEDRKGYTGRTLSISALSEIIALLRKNFQWIIVDSGPVRDIAFSLVLARFMSGTVVVAESEKTRMPVVHQLVHQIYANGGTSLGIVINKRKKHIADFLYRFL
jgi:polysaccharide biosynthesis transport protein